jgi:hypothetical protein
VYEGILSLKRIKVQYINDMVCHKGGAAGVAPNSTVFIYDTPGRKVDPIAHCTYVVEWHHPAACPSKAS